VQWPPQAVSGSSLQSSESFILPPFREQNSSFENRSRTGAPPRKLPAPPLVWGTAPGWRSTGTLSPSRTRQLAGEAWGRPPRHQQTGPPAPPLHH